MFIFSNRAKKVKKASEVVVFLSLEDIDQSIFRDFYSDNRLAVRTDLYRRSKIGKKLYSKARIISTYTKIKFLDSIYLFIYSLFFCKLFLSKGNKYVFSNLSLLGISPLYFRIFFTLFKKKKPYLLFIDKADKVGGRHAFRCCRKVKPNNVFTFEKKDSIEHGFNHSLSFYSVIKNVKRFNKEYDSFYIGWYVPDRFRFIASLDKALKNRTNSRILIIGNGIKHIEGSTIFNVPRFIKYEKVLQLVNSSNCILEVLQEGQSGATMRYAEAVIYNKKLLTNNDNIVNLPFYNPKYMKIFHSDSDIDDEWIMKKETIDYHYDNRFSPINIIEYIINKG